MNIFSLFNLLPGWLHSALYAGAFAWGAVNAYQVKALKTDLSELKSEHASAESERVREANREIARLVDVTNNLNEVYSEQVRTIDALERRSRTDRVRLTKAERDAAIAGGSAEAVRRYATVAGDVYQACRDEYRALGYDAARGSAATYTLKDWVDSLPAAKEFENRLKEFNTRLKGPTQ